MLKRAFDIVAASALLLLLSPVLLIAYAAIVMQDRGPGIFRQKRIGKDGEIFDIFKFRTMVRDAEKIGGFATRDGDSRITPVGRFLRRTSIDELPQLLNVLRGDMSLVGPRPDVPAQRELYTAEEFSRRQSVRPGITGLAQAQARSRASVEERKRLDLAYVDGMSMSMDFRVLLLTLQQIVKKDGN